MSSNEESTVSHHPIKPIELLPAVSVVLLMFVLIAASMVASAIALVSIPTSLAVLGVFALCLLSSVNLVRWWRRNTGSISMTDDELIVRPRSGPILRRNLSDIRSIERFYVERLFRAGAVRKIYFENYVRIVSSDQIPLQFLWDVDPRSKRTSDVNRLVWNLHRRLPSDEIIESPGSPNVVTVAHGRRNFRTNHQQFVMAAVAICGTAAVVINVLVPGSSGSAAHELKGFERSVNNVRATSLPGDESTTARSIPCFGENGGSYWEEDFFNLEIRRVEMQLVVLTDPKTAEARARKLLPKNWEVYGSDFLPGDVGKATLYLKTPCLTANKGEFYPSLEAGFTTAMEKLRTKVDEGVVAAG